MACRTSSRLTFTPRHSHSRCIFVCLLLMLATCGLVSAEVPKPKTSACALTEDDAGSSFDASVDIHALSNYSKAIYALFQARQFGQLDCIADSARTGKETFAGGMWKIHAIYAGLGTPPLHPTEQDWVAHIGLLQRWVAARPESITARIALATTYANYGADARGKGMADTVSESGWKLLAERSAKARQILEKASTLRAKDPEWYVAMQQVALLQQWEPAEKQTLLEKAMQFEPAYYYYYRMYGFSILPKWGGEDGEVADFLQKTADKIGGDAGDEVYFRVAGYLFCGCASDLELKLSWPRIQKGFDAVEKQYGPAPANLNQLAHMAITFNDPMVAGKAFARIGDQWDKETWETSENYESYKEWAKQAGLIVAKKQVAEDSAEANVRTAEGRRYNAAFDEVIHTWVRQCMEEIGGADPGKFELLIKVGKDGTIAEMNGSPASSFPFTNCLGSKMNNFRASEKVVFPPPPQPDYWVLYHLNPENTPSAALK
jgi:hypothetical protein